MDNLSEEDINIRNQFEIEEKVASILKFEEDIKYFTEKLRRTTPGQFTIKDRLKPTKKRLTHWNNLATSFAIKYFGQNNIKETEINMPITEQGDSSSATGGSSDIKMLAEMLKEVILANKKRDDFDFLEKPKKFNGSRDPHVIDSWLLFIEDFGALKGYDHEQMCKLGVTLLTGSGAIWYQNLRLLKLAPRDWLSFKRDLIDFFKSENTVAIARDKIRNLRQTSTISKYVQEFMKIKLGIPNMTDEEAVDKFIAGIKDPAARIHIKDNIPMENPALNEVIRVAHIYEGNCQDFVPVSSGFSSAGNLSVDDPMDLSVAERRELYNMMKQWNNSAGNGFRGGYNGARGGRGNYNGGRGGSARGNVQCHNCEGYGHYKRECPSPPRAQLNYAKAGDDSIDFDGSDFDNKDLDSSAYLHCVLPTSESYVEPLLIDGSAIQKNLDFVLSAGKIDAKLPLYHGLVNGHSCSIFIDSGASANYISPNMLPAVTQFRLVQGQAVETANGHQQSAISSIVTFSLQLGDYKDVMETYVFDTKFDLIMYG